MRIFFFILFMLINNNIWADPKTDQPSPLFGDVNGTNAGRYRSVKFSNGSTTNNGDGSISVTTGGAGSGYSTIQDETVDLTQRTKLNFTGTGVVCADNGGTLVTDCTINSGGGSSQWFTQVESNGNVGVGTYNSVGIGTTMGNGSFIVMPTVAGTNVGIGTWNPNNKLDVKGDATVNGNIGIGTSLTTTAALSVLGGNVGVGTWVPAGLFNVNLNGLAATSTDGIILSNNTITTGGATAQLNPRVRQRGHYWSGSVDQTIDWKQEVTTGTGVGSQIFSYSDNGGAYNTVLTMTKSSNATFAGVLQGASLIAASGGNATVPITVTAPTGMTGNMQTWARNLLPLSMMNNNGNLGIGTLMAENKISVAGPVGIGTGYNSPFLSTVGPTGGMIIEGNVGIGTTIPQNGLALMGGYNIGIGTFAPTSSISVMAGNVGIGTRAPQSALTLGGNNHLGSTGTAPTVANNDCGTTSQGTVNAGSTDIRGSVVAGTLAVTSCAVTFNNTFGLSPICLTQDDTNILGVKNTQTTTKMTITSTSSMSGDTISWICIE